MKAQDLMTKHVQKCGPDDTLEQAARVMWEADVGWLPVVDEEGRAVGIVTDRDICMAAYTQGIALRDARVWSAMSKKVVTCQPDHSIAEIEAMMRATQIRRIPVVDLIGCVVGVVTLGDIARHVHGPLHVAEAPAVAKTLASISERRGVSAAAE